jgi:hypothetical protein
MERQYSRPNQIDPTVTAVAGDDDVQQSGTINSPNFSAGDYVQAELDQKESGNAGDLSITIEVRYTS